MFALESALSREEYLTELKGCLMSPFAIFNERVTGIVVGSFFSVAYYSPYEWNRRITSECNRAWGWVKEVDGKTEVCFIRGKGRFSPFWLITFTLVFVAAVSAAIFTENGGTLDISGDMGMIWIFGSISSVVICGVTALHSSVTEEGIAGAGEITRMLRDPSQYYC